MIRPRIFIGSSTKGLLVAAKVKQNLESVGDCYLWNNREVWENNLSTFDNLIQMTAFFDFGVFVATEDDLTYTNGRIVVEPRDNVILEMALFTGALGKDKSFLIVQEGLKLPSDFDGIYQPRFDISNFESISSVCKKIAQEITEQYNHGYLSLYPTTALAIGYFKNFLSGLVDSIAHSESVLIDSVEYSKFEIKVVMPKDLSGTIKEKAALFYRRANLSENTLNTKFRKYPTWFQLDSSDRRVAKIFDMPTTLTGIDDAIDLILNKKYVGRNALQNIIEQREINNFKRVLQFKIDESPFAKGLVEIIDEY